MSNEYSRWFTAAQPLVAGNHAPAETGRQAPSYAGRISPSLTTAGAGLCATDEEVAVAEAAEHPTLDATADFQGHVLRSAKSFSAPFVRPANPNANPSIPIYHGGRVRNSIGTGDVRVSNCGWQTRALPMPMSAQRLFWPELTSCATMWLPDPTPTVSLFWRRTFRRAMDRALGPVPIRRTFGSGILDRCGASITCLAPPECRSGTKPLAERRSTEETADSQEEAVHV